MMDSFNIFVTSRFAPEAQRLLEEGVAPHRLVFESDALRNADIALGQPDPAILMASATLRWAQVTSAGYTRYDRDDVRAALRARGATLTNSSSVYAEPCAQHAAAMMLALARQLPQCWAESGQWNSGERRAQSFLLDKCQRVLFLGFGAIGRRLAELLAPFDMDIVALRRQASGEEGVRIIGEDELARELKFAHHVVNLLPENDATRDFMSAGRFAQMRRGAFYYSIGRGVTTDQDALLQLLQMGHLGAAYLDVTTPEPLPPEHPLWTAPNCFITPHSAGGHADEDLRLVRHFLKNLIAFRKGRELADRVI